MAYNVKDGELSTPFQPGGTMVLSLNTAAHRVFEIGKDTTGLGRWSWSRYRGRHDLILHVISAYRPCIPQDPGENTTHSQHQRYLDAHNDTRHPRNAMLEDLESHITQYKNQGDQIVVLMDCNEDVRRARITTWLQRLELTDVIMSTHGSTQAPATYNRGSKPIDGIFCSSTIPVQACGYLPFGAFPLDHRGLWIDVLYENAFGYKIPRCIQPAAQKLQCKDPRVVSKWVNAYDSFIRTHNLHVQQFELERLATLPLTPAMAKEFEDILELRTKGIQHADKKC